jgi:primosomal protein N'
MYLSIIPFSHSIGTSPLTYVWGDIFSDDIPIGSIAMIPLGKWQELWLIVWISEENLEMREDIRTILQVITKRTVIAPYQIDMILFLSRRYMLPIHRVLGFFLTQPTLKRLEKYGYDILSETTQASQLSSLWKKELIFFSETTITSDILRPYLWEKTIIICPDDFSLENYRKDFENEHTFFFSTDLTDTRKAKAWIDIRNGKYTQIFWSRRLLYYNLAHYTHIIYLEDAFGKEYFHYPSRIHYLDVLFSLERTEHMNVSILTSVPLLTTLSQAKHFNIINYTH